MPNLNDGVFFLISSGKRGMATGILPREFPLQTLRGKIPVAEKQKTVIRFAVVWA